MTGSELDGKVQTAHGKLGEANDALDDVLLKSIRETRKLARAIAGKLVGLAQTARPGASVRIYLLSQAATALNMALARLHDPAPPEGESALTKLEGTLESEETAAYVIGLLFVLGRVDGFDPIASLMGIHSELQENFEIPYEDAPAPPPPPAVV